MAVGRHSSATLSRTKLVALAVASCFAGAVHANPVGPTVMHGTASFNAVGNAFNITNSPNAIINWQGFSIGAGEITRFVQNSVASSVLNRVTGAESSSILGQLLSNGRVLLINPNGVFIGGGAVVDVAGFTASSLKISDADFLAGKFKFTDQVGAARIVNQGIIRTPEGGQVHLIAPGVENSGIITSPGGQVILAAGKTVELVDAGSPYVRVEFTAPDHAAVNVGQIVADAGSVGIYGTAIKHSGIVRANSAQAGANGRIVFKAMKDVTLDAGSRLQANGPSGGDIAVQAEAGTLLASGVVEARGEDDQGGNVKFLGTRVGLIGSAGIDASGEKGGGTVLVGGDFRGRNTAVQNAQRTYVGPDATIRADALSEGDGGKVIVWSEDTTRVYGTITAKGGTQGGDGGFIEVSGKDFLDFSARIDASAPKGAYGTLLLDPADIVVATSGAAAVTAVDAFADSGATETISPTTLSGAVAATVVLQATNDITVSDPVTFTTAGKGFVAQAGRDININAAVTTNGGNIHLEADSPHSTSGGGNGVGIVKVAAAVSTLGSGATGGAVTLIGGADSNPSGGFDLSADVNAGTGGISLSLTNSGTFDLGIGAGGSTQLASRTTDFLKTTGALVLGQATTAGSDGLGSGALTLKVNSITNSTSTPIELSAQSGSSFQLIAGAGGILLDKPLTTYQDTVISTTGTLTINQTLATSDSNLTLTAGTVVLGGSGSVNIGSGTCTGTACTTLGVDTSQIFWDGDGSDGNWFNAANWRLSSTNPNNVLPDLTRDVTIDTTAGFGTIQIGTGGAALAKSLVTGRPVVLSSGSLELANASTFSDSLTFSGGTLQGAGGVTVGGTGGALTWSGGTAATSAGTLLLASGHSGTLSNALSLNRLFQNDGTLTLNAATITGTGSITNNGTLTATSTNPVSKMLLALGSIGGAGSLTVNDWSRTGGVFNMAGTASLRVPTGNFTVDRTYSAGNLTLLAAAGGIDLNAAVTASGNLTLSSTGSVTQTAAVTASGLELLGTGGSYTLTNTGNAITTLAANTGSVSYTDANALSVGIVNATTGINATGLVDVRTQTGDLTLSNAIATTSTSSNAVTLVADVAATPDATGTGGNFKNAGSVAITTGGAWRIYTGNPTGTTRGGLAEAGKRYNVDDGSDPIGSGKRIYFRIQPTLTLTADNKSKTYGDANPSFTVGVSGTLLETDTQGTAITGAPSFAVSGSTSTSGQLTAGTLHNITPSAAASGLGYSFTYADGTLTVSQKGLTGSITADNKVYNANDSATLATRTLSGAIGGDAVSYTGGTATFDTKNVGTGKTVTATGLGLSGADLGNYTVNATATTTANITAANLAVTGVTAANKTYDATTAVTLGGVAAVTALGTDVVTLGGTGSGAFADKNVGNGKTVTVTGYTLGGAAAGNYTLVQPAGVTANIIAAGLTVSGITAANKIYDATTAATVNTAGAVYTGLIGGDAVVVSATGTFANKSVGNGKTVTLANTYAGADAGNYAITNQASTTANITAANLAVTGVTAANKVYDANTAAALGGVAAVTALGTDALTLGGTGSGAFADKNVGNAKAVAVTGYTLGGTDAGNYTLVQPAGLTANITAATLTVTGFTAQNKVYDATTAATVSGGTLGGVLGGDTVSLTGLTGSFANKNVGTGKTVLVSGGTLTGTGAGNYQLTSGSGSTTANITVANLAVTGVTAANKVYDATTAASVSGGLGGVLGNDSVSLNGLSGSFANKNVGTGKVVAVSGGALIGADAGNYQLTPPSGSTTADITPATLTATGFLAQNKVYDATTAATVSGGTLGGVLGGDAVSLSGLTGSFANKNVGTGKTVTVSGGTLTGTDAGNYQLSSTSGSATADITPATLAATGFAAQNKVYDATTAATVSGGLGGVFSGDVVSLTGLSGSFANKNVGTGKTVTVSGGALAGADAGNYQLGSASGSTTASITAATLTISGFTAQNKVYDATTAATVSGGTLGGVSGGDAVSLSGLTGSFANKNVGTGKTVTVSGGTLTGTDAGNYQLTAASGSTTANITAATLTATGFTAQNKVYDASTAATVSGGTLGGVLGGDAVSFSALSGSFANKNVGTGKTVTVSGGTLAGADAGNYQLTAGSGSTTANITPATLTATGFTAQNKVYDATTAATVLGGALGGVFSGDAVSLAGLLGSFANKNVGTGKTVTVSGGTLAGADAGNYQFTPASGSTTANITPATLTATDFTAQDKVYDASTAASVSGGTLGGVFSGDAVSLAGLSGSFADKNVGTGKTVTVSGGTLTGTDAGNYQLNSASGNTTANITPATLLITAATNAKTYDGNTSASATPAVSGLRGGDMAAGFTEVYSDPDVGTGKTLLVSGYTINDGTGGANYKVTLVNDTTGAITPATATLITESLSPVQLAINSMANQINISATTVDEGPRVTPIKAINEGARVTPVQVGNKSKDDANLPACN